MNFKHLPIQTFCASLLCLYTRNICYSCEHSLGEVKYDDHTNTSASFSPRLTVCLSVREKWGHEKKCNHSEAHGQNSKESYSIISKISCSEAILTNISSYFIKKDVFFLQCLDISTVKNKTQ